MKSLPLLIACLAALFGVVWVIAVERAVTPIQLTRHANGSVDIKVTGLPGKHYRIEAAEDLSQWRSVALMQGLGPLTHSVSNGTTGMQFFRAVEIPGSAGMTGEVIANTEEGEIVFRPVDHASFVMHWNGTTIYNDPVGSASDYRRMPDPDVILVSHQHGDHFSSSTITSLKEEHTLIVVPAAVFSQLSSAAKEAAVVLANGESFDTGSVTIDAVPAYNDRHPKGRDNGYVVNMGGRRVYMSGDTEDVAEMRALKDVDVAFLAMNLPFTMSVDQAAGALLDFRAKVVYPYHYRNSDGSFADLDRLRSALNGAPEIEVRTAKWY